MPNGYTHKCYTAPLLGERLDEGLVFSSFVLNLAFQVEVRAETHFDQEEGALLLVEGCGVWQGGIRYTSGVDEIGGDSVSRVAKW